VCGCVSVCGCGCAGGQLELAPAFHNYDFYYNARLLGLHYEIVLTESTLDVEASVRAHATLPCVPVCVCVCVCVCVFEDRDLNAECLCASVSLCLCLCAVCERVDACTHRGRDAHNCIHPYMHTCTPAELTFGMSLVVHRNRCRNVKGPSASVLASPWTLALCRCGTHRER
jgi:hypothetical protein